MESHTTPGCAMGAATTAQTQTQATRRRRRTLQRMQKLFLSCLTGALRVGWPLTSLFLQAQRSEGNPKAARSGLPWISDEGSSGAPYRSARARQYSRRGIDLFSKSHSSAQLYAQSFSQNAYSTVCYLKRGEARIRKVLLELPPATQKNARRRSLNTAAAQANTELRDVITKLRDDLATADVRILTNS